MTDREFSMFCKTNQPVGCLHKRHPEYLFGAVYRTPDNKLILGPNVNVPTGLEVRLWDKSVIIA